jgi:hypothetical protein
LYSEMDWKPIPIRPVIDHMFSRRSGDEVA